MKDLKIIFLGTPNFAIPSLEGLLKADIKPLMIITQPDRPSGRGQKIIKSAVKELAEKHNLLIRQPIKIARDLSLIEEIKALKPDLMVTVAFGQILSQEIIDIAKWGIWNVHASLLPRWRGAAPIQWSILNGDLQTGITIMQTEKGLDTGPILNSRSLDITETDTAETLNKKLSVLGAELLLTTIINNYDSPIKAQAQINDENLVKYASKITKEMSVISWAEINIIELNRKFRALNPWPGIHFDIFDEMNNLIEERIKIQKVDYHLLDNIIDIKQSSLGEIIIREKKVFIQLKDGFLELKEILPSGKKNMLAIDWINDLKNKVKDSKLYILKRITS